MSPFTIIAEPNRRWILDQLQVSPASVNDLVEGSGMSQPAMSKHLRTLRDAGLVTSVAEGQKRVYHLNPTPLKALDEWLHPYRAFWSQKLDDLEAHLAGLEED